jgi:putative hemolysin
VRGLLLSAFPVALAVPLVAVSASVAVEGAVLLTLLVLSGLFSGTEVAMFSLTDRDREALRADESAGSRRVLRLLERPRRLLITILLLNNFTNVGAAILATVMTMRAARAYGLVGDPVGEVLLFTGQVVVLTFLLLVLSEITPKLVATHRNVRWAKAVSLPLWGFFQVARPLSGLLAQGMELVHRRVRTPKPVISSEDLKTLADLGEREGTLEEEERDLIHSIVEFGETTVREVMVSRLDVHALPENATLEEAFALIRETGHSRFPVYREHLDNVLGVLYAKDLIPHLGATNGTPPPAWAEVVRPARFVPLGRKLDDMLVDFQASGTHIAIVVDEYGGTAGVISLEDILEEIVGDIRDEHDRPEPLPYERVDATTFRVDAGIDLDDLNEAFDLDLDTSSYDFETLGGLILHVTGDIPEAGTPVAYGRLQMRVEEVEGNRIKRVLLEVLPEPSDEPDSEAAPAD